MFKRDYFLTVLATLIFAIATLSASAQSTVTFTVKSAEGAGYKSVDRVLYREDFFVKTDLKSGPFSFDVPVNTALPGGDSSLHDQIIVGYAGSLNEGIAVSPRVVHSGKSYEIDVSILDLEKLNRRETIRKICDVSPLRRDIEKVFQQYFTCRRIAASAIQEDLATFKALKGWWESYYVLATQKDWFVGDDPDVLGKLEEYRKDESIADRFSSIFDSKRLDREINEVLTRRLQDIISVDALAKAGRGDDAKALNQQLIKIFDSLAPAVQQVGFYKIDRKLLEQKMISLDALPKN